MELIGREELSVQVLHLDLSRVSDYLSFYGCIEGLVEWVALKSPNGLVGGRGNRVLESR